MTRPSWGFDLSSSRCQPRTLSSPFPSRRRRSELFLVSCSTSDHEQSGTVDTFASQKKALDELWNELLVAVSLSAPLTIVMWTGTLPFSPLHLPSLSSSHGDDRNADG
jgi:hypothetical protein